MCWADGQDSVLSAEHVWVGIREVAAARGLPIFTSTAIATPAATPGSKQKSLGMAAAAVVGEGSREFPFSHTPSATAILGWVAVAVAAAPSPVQLDIWSCLVVTWLL